MIQFNTILFPVDFSDRCRGAARYVETFAERFGSRIILLHVLESTIGQPGDLDFGGLASSLQWEDRVRHAREMLAGFLKEELSSLNVERRFETGDPARTIVKVAHTEKLDLVMMPTHGYGGFRRFVLGSVTAKVLHDADCPVWTGVHMDESPKIDAARISNILCALDLAKDNDASLSAAVQLADQYKAILTVGHVVPGSDAIPEKLMDREFRSHLTMIAREDLEALCARRGIKAHISVEGGDIGPTVGRMAKENHADLVVIGRGHHSGLGRLRTQSYAIIRESPCPVLSV